MTDQFFEPDTVQCPYPHYQQLQHNDPVHQLDGEDVFLVTRYADCEHVLRTPDVYSNKAGPGLRQKELMGRTAAPPDLKHRVVRTLLTNDAPSHQRYRRLVAGAFSARRIGALEPQITAEVDRLIDAMPMDGEIDFVRDFAEPLPLSVIVDLLGVPRSDLDDFRRWSLDAAEVLGGTLSEERSRECHESLAELLEYLAAQVDIRRDAPADDFLTTLLQADVEGERPLTLEEIISISYVTLVAGNETTANMLSSLMWLLLSHPDEFRRIRHDRSLVSGAVEEALRLEAPVQGSVRIATGDSELRGTVVPTGSRILITTGAANRDASVFEEPDQFDPERDNARDHLSFGKGIHYCLGAALSRLEGVIALDRLLDRVETFEPVYGFQPLYRDNAVLRSMTSLPVRISRTVTA